MHSKNESCSLTSWNGKNVFSKAVWDVEEPRARDEDETAGVVAIEAF
jgi:archaeosine-15-forming tRNA-guanine transglycosylase